MAAYEFDRKTAKSLLLITSANGIGKLPETLSHFSIRFHLPSPELEVNIASLLSGLHPGHVLLTGKEELKNRTFLQFLVQNKFKFFFDVPEELSFLLPEEAKRFSLASLNSLTEPYCSWIHFTGAVPEDFKAALSERGQNVPVACIALGTERTGKPPWLEEDSWQTGCFSVPFAPKAPSASILDFFPTLTKILGLPFPLNDGRDLSWDNQDNERVFFSEDWRRRVLKATHNGNTFAGWLRRRRLPEPVGRIAWRWSNRASPEHSGRSIWEFQEVIHTLSRMKLSPLGRLGPAKANSEQSKRLAVLLEAHIASYAAQTDERVLGRLEDLGYL